MMSLDGQVGMDGVKQYAEWFNLPNQENFGNCTNDAITNTEDQDLVNHCFSIMQETISLLRDSAGFTEAYDTLLTTIRDPEGNPPGNYVNEADYFQPDWQDTFWGSNYPRLLE